MLVIINGIQQYNRGHTCTTNVIDAEQKRLYKMYMFKERTKFV